MATNGKQPRDLMAARINRLEKQLGQQGVETNKRLDETNKRLDQVVEVLGSIANILAGQGKELERHSQLLQALAERLDRLTERFDRFADMVIVGRTRDTERVTELERRVGTLELQVFGSSPPPRS